MGKRRIGGHVLPREDAGVAERLVDPVDVVLPLEEAPQPRGRHLSLDRFRIDAGARLVQRGLIAQVGGEDLDRRIRTGLLSRNSISAIASE